MKIISKTNQRENWNILWMLALIPLLSFFACEQKEVDRRIEQLPPEQTAKMAKAIEAKVNPELAENLSLEIWGVDSLVADPVAIDVDNHGHLYYTQTNRQTHSEFDIRRHQDWETQSLSLQSIEDKRAFFHEVLSPENSAENEWLADLNNDGSHDWRDLTVAKENVYRLEDTSGDGIADLSQLVLSGFSTEVTDVAGAILSHDGDLFVGVAPDLWRVEDQNGDGTADKKTSISHGYGVHVGFGGHGMSGLTVGPAGRIYWGIGDIGFNGEGPDGKEWKYPNQGVIVRSNPDGSDFEVFAHGLRNTHEFVFDEHGNLISVDNDGDHPGEEERLVYIVNGSDSGWRINWQFGKYDDPNNNSYKVWMDEKMYKPRFEGQAAHITPAIANYVSGPAGMIYNPGTALGPEWEDTFFISEFVGNPARSGIHAFKLKPKGASFELVETEMIMSGVLATGIDFGPDGAMYIADWIEGWGTKDFGRIWKLDTKNGPSWEQRKITKDLLAEDFGEHGDERLGELLFNPDMRVRQKAQFELAKRGPDGAAIFQESIGQTKNQLARIHGIWGISQLARKDIEYAKLLLPLLKDGDPEIRAQAAKWLGDVRYEEAGDELIPLLEDGYSRARFFAAEALGRIAHGPAVQPIIDLLRANDGEDAYIRHAGSLALARIGKAEPIVALADSPSRALRVAAVVVLRKLEHPGVAKFLDDPEEYVVTEAARAIHDDRSIEEALPALGNLLDSPRFTNEALVRRAINANLRVGGEEAMQNLIGYALQEGNPVEMRAEAIAALGNWAAPSVLDRVTGRHRGTIKRDPEIIIEKAKDDFLALLGSPKPTLRSGAIEAIGRLGIGEAAPRLVDLLQDDPQAEVRVEALEVLAAMKYEKIGKAIEHALSDEEKNVRIAGLDLMPKMDLPEDLMVSLLSEVIETKTIGEKQAALLTLGDLPLEHTRETFGALLDRMESGDLPPEIHLELAEAIELANSRELKTRLAGISSTLSPDPLLASFQGSLRGGDPAVGRSIFFGNQAAQCVRCHSLDDIGGSAGPRLNGVGSRLSRQEILESLINPGERLAAGFGNVSVELENGKTLSGILEKENEAQITLRIGNEGPIVVPKEQIVERTNAASSMPNMRYLLSKREIRDVVSFLASLKKDEMGKERPGGEAPMSHGQ